MTLSRVPSAPLSVVAALLLAGLLSGAHAQTAPTGGELLREAEKTAPRPAAPVLPEPARPAPVDESAGAAVLVRSFRIEGARLVDEAELQALLQPWIGTRAGMASLRRAADALAELYRERGYLARAWLPEQEIRDGVVRLRIVEGRLSDLRIERTQAERALPDETLRAMMFARQQPGEPVRPDDLQRAVALLDEMPGMHATAVLEPGEREGESRIILAVTGAPLLSGSVQFDNAGARATGEARATLNLSLNAPLARGDQWQFSGNLSEHSRYARLGASMPLGADGLRVGMAVSSLDYGYTLGAVGYDGDVATTSATASWPVLRRAARNLTLSATAETKRFRNAVAGTPLSDKSVDKASLALQGDRQDAWGGGGVFMGSLQIDGGRLDLSGHAADLASDQIDGGPGRDGNFAKLVATLSRLQRLSATQTLTVTATAQAASRNLDSSEKLQLTGPQGVRAYSVSEPSVDRGVLLSVDWRMQLRPGWFVGVFHDEARGRRDADENASSSAPNRLILRGTGLSLSWDAPGDIQVRASVAWRDTANPARNPATGQDADGTRRHTRLLVTAARAF